MTAYEYQATVLDIHDGDTAKLSIRLSRLARRDIDYGFHIHVEGRWLVLHASIRFLGINAPELATPEGKTALAYLRTLIAVGDVVTVRSAPGKPIGPDKFARWDGVIVRADGLNVNDAMLAAGQAVPYL